jgi:hypothetical protein
MIEQLYFVDKCTMDAILQGWYVNQGDHGMRNHHPGRIRVCL